MTTKVHHAFLNENGLINSIDAEYCPIYRDIRLDLFENKSDSTRITILNLCFYVSKNNSIGYTPSVFSKEELQAVKAVLEQVVPFPLNTSTLNPVKEQNS